MRRTISLLATGLMVLSVLFAGPTARASSDSDVIPNSWIVELKPGHDPRTESQRLTRQYGGEVRHVYTAALRGFSFTGSDRAANGMSRNAKVLRVEADRVMRAIAASKVPTGVVRIDSRTAGGAHAVSTSTGSGVRVAVLDTGVDKDHEQFGGRVVAGADCIGERNSTYDGNGHGTHVAGTVAGAEVGVAPGATIVAVKVLDSSGSGSWSSVTCGVDYVTSLNDNSSSTDDVAVANMSLGGSSSENPSSCASSTLHTAICNSVASGAAYSVAAGNDSRNAGGFVPAKYPEVLTISAFSDLDGVRDPENGSECAGVGPWKDCDETFARFSNYGEIVDVMAPGVRIYSSLPGNKYDTYSGTSMAAPHVAGVAALVLEDNALTVAQLEARLESTGECPNATWATTTGSCSGSWSGDGDTIAEPMVNAARAVSNTTGGDSGGGETVTTGTVFGTVTDSSTNAAISGAVVTVDGTTLSGTTDANGEYSIADVPDGSHNVTASASGYTSLTKTVNVTGGSTADLDFALAQSSSETTGYSTTTSYLPSGGPKGDKHMDITAHVEDSSGPVANATVVADITYPSGVWSGATGTTDSSGNVVFSLKNSGPGCYQTDVNTVNGATPTSETDGGYCTPT